jgi:hypothetical protein
MSKLLLGLLFLDRKFKSPYQIEEFLPHIEKVLKLAEEKEELTPEERNLLKKLIYKLERFSEFTEEQIKIWFDKFKLEGRL